MYNSALYQYFWIPFQFSFEKKFQLVDMIL